jgi:hypothetical protein
MGGYLPVPLFTEALIKAGYCGWWSLEVFNASLEDDDKECPRRHGIRGLKGLRRLREEMEGLGQKTHIVGQGELPGLTWSTILATMQSLLKYMRAEWVFRLLWYFRTSSSRRK